jgi:hypothetical protein
MSLSRRITERLKWYRGAWWYDKTYGGHYLFRFVMKGGCHHRTRLLGLPCFREANYDHWCGFHNSLCWRHEADSNRCSQ